MARVRSIDRHRYRPLTHWSVLGTEPGALQHPRESEDRPAGWWPGQVPGTVAGSLRATGGWRLGVERSFDAQDWWYRCRFEVPAEADTAEPKDQE